MPVHFPGLDPGRVARMNFTGRLALQLDAANPRQNMERLPLRMGMPCGPRAGFEGDAGGLEPGGRACGDDLVDPHGTGEPIGGPLRQPRIVSVRIFIFTPPVTGAL